MKQSTAIKIYINRGKEDICLIYLVIKSFLHPEIQGRDLINLLRRNEIDIRSVIPYIIDLYSKNIIHIEHCDTVPDTEFIIYEIKQYIDSGQPKYNYNIQITDKVNEVEFETSLNQYENNVALFYIN